MANIGIYALGVILYLWRRGNVYPLDYASLALFFVLTVEVCVCFEIAKRRQEPLLTLLGLYVTLYYIFRFPTLSVFADYTQFVRGYFRPTDSSALNRALLFIAFALPLFIIGLAMRRPSPSAIDPGCPLNPAQARATSRVVTMAFVLNLIFKFAVAFVFGYFVGGQIVTASLRIMRYLTTIVNDFVLLAALVTTWYTHPRRREWIDRFAVGIVLMGAYIGLTAMNGSRSGVLVTLIICFCTILAYQRFVMVKWRHVVAAAAIVPMAVAIFPLATSFRYIKQTQFNEKRVDVEDFTVSALADYRDVAGENFQQTYANTFQRLSYLDIFAEIMANDQAFRSAFNLGTVGRSLIDNLLTPGFNIWDEPRVSHQISKLYTGQVSILTGEYVSDAVTIFGDFYIFLGGWFSLLFIIPVAMLVKMAYYKIHGRNIFETILYRGCYLLWFIHLFLGSFGIDWWIIEGVWLGGSAVIVAYVVRYLTSGPIVEVSPRGQ